MVTGLNDNQYTQLVSGELAKGQKLVTGLLAAGDPGIETGD
jgi:hypothetical protein